MSRHLRGICAAGIPLLLLAAATSWAQDDLVANPFYKFWSASKPGATAVHLETTKLSGPEGKLVPGGEDERRIAYKVIAIKDNQVVVEQVVTERDFLGYVQAAPTRYIYPAKIKKASLDRIFVTDGDKAGEGTVKVGDKDIACKTLSGVVKGANGEQTDFKVWLSDDVPGAIVKQVRTARQKGELIAETTTTLKSFKNAE